MFSLEVVKAVEKVQEGSAKKVSKVTKPKFDLSIKTEEDDEGQKEQ